jgi:hypothetical protein
MSAVKKEPKVAPEVALEEFGRWMEAMGLEVKLDPERMDDQDKAGLAINRTVLLRAITDGSLVVKDTGEFVFTPKAGGDALTFYEPDGGALQAMDQAKDGAPVQRMVKLICAMTRSTPKTISNLKIRDYAVCESIAVLFLAK